MYTVLFAPWIAINTGGSSVYELEQRTDSRLIASVLEESLPKP